jgi:AAA+ ATPase superfamily predicted ATPase
MARFVDRKDELAFLEDRFRRGGLNFIPVYGRRRIGKTRLLQEFLRGKPAIYFLAQTVSQNEQLRNLGRAVGTHFDDSILADHGFSSWDEAFTYIRGRSREPLIWVIDEFPYLVAATGGISSMFQHAIDERWKGSRLFLVLMGSSMGMMEREVLLEPAPLYGRRTGALHVEEMPFTALGEFFPRKSTRELVQIYGLAGAVPAYLEKVDPAVSFWRTVDREVLAKGSYLYDEVEFLLREELREPQSYFVILRAIAQGKRRLSEIINDTGFEKSAVAKYLVVLQRLQIVRREVPATEKHPDKSKLGLYRLHDRFFSFWFRFVLNNRARLELGNRSGVLEEIRRGYDQYLGDVFEDVCRSHCLELVRRGELALSSLGRWWDRQDEIDLVGLDPGSGTLHAGEVRWRNKPVGIDLLEDLQRKTARIDWMVGRRKERYLIFSKAGFTRALVERARQEDVRLFDLDALR